MGRKKRNNSKDFDPKKIKNLKVDEESISAYSQSDEKYKAWMFLASTKNGDRGIKIVSKHTNTKSLHSPGIWIPERINFAKFFDWFFSGLKRIVYGILGKELPIEEKIKALEKENDNLKKKIKKLIKELELQEKELEEKRRELELAKKVKKKVDRYEEELKEFIALLEKSKNENKGNEGEIRKFLAKHPWIFGLECEVGAEQQDIDPSSELDLHIITEYRENRIIELKSPNLNPFEEKDKNKRLIVRRELAEGINQLIIYMRKLNLYEKINEPGPHGVRNPSGVLVIGYRISKAQSDTLKDWSFHLKPHIVILTYDQLVEKAKRTVEIIKEAKGE